MSSHHQSTVSSIPPELISVICGHLRDAVDLRNCSLVCKTWYDICRPHIFYTLRITDEDHLRKFLSLVGSEYRREVPTMEGEEDEENREDMTVVDESELSSKPVFVPSAEIAENIRHWIRSLSIVFPRPFIKVVTIHPAKRMYAWNILNALTQAVNPDQPNEVILPSVSRLLLQNFITNLDDASPLNDTQLLLILRKLRGVQTLVFRGVLLADTTFRGFLGIWPDLKDLRIQGAMLSEDPFEDASIVYTPPPDPSVGLQHLELNPLTGVDSAVHAADSMFELNTLKWLLQESRTKHTLRSLKVTTIAMGQMRYICDLIASVGGVLEELDIRHVRMKDLDQRLVTTDYGGEAMPKGTTTVMAFARDLDLSHCTALRSLTISPLRKCYDDIFRRLPSRQISNLESVIFDMTEADNDENLFPCAPITDEGENWAAQLDDLFGSKDVFPKLKEVRIKHSGLLPVYSARCAVVRHFPKTGERGILSVVKREETYRDPEIWPGPYTFSRWDPGDVLP
ncbi:hypothetical protein K474DRAFT_1663978 [Panus rudis PR-1116 ss-1]|nr:hypothetical protein K474DRAFT_1663978 [Panus rudis PR-1116 ss-1]